MTDIPPSSRSAPAVVVIGASAGGLQPLRTLVEGLPADLDAAVLVVVHLAASGTSFLAQILGRSAHMPVEAATDGAPLRAGRVLVAPPDLHLLVDDGRAVLSRSARENGHRPSVDALFRSAAEAFGPACIGVVLSGTRDDGSAGLGLIAARGGTALVQDPADALHPSMPANAIAAAAVDAVLPARELAAEIVTRLVTSPRPAPGNGDGLEQPGDGEDPLAITCPECGGTLREIDEGGVLRFSCHVGHRYSPRSMLAAHAESVERAMWTAVRMLDDRATLLRRLSDRTGGSGNQLSAAQFQRGAEQAESEADDLRRAIASLDDQPLMVPPEEVAG